jgi:hypothetical protein
MMLGEAVEVPEAEALNSTRPLLVAGAAGDNAEAQVAEDHCSLRNARPWMIWRP